ncbi:hypothetical protein [Phaeodactylibacter xiamenensis]|uniref:hypothetical protein n=1 Tax=Phaeodactylibacter xiamenensis TaxID=1524460 RepID=UPI0024A81A12|nr:hypothetical protein [Phaeodactylibacter xiamenensis]
MATTNDNVPVKDEEQPFPPPVTTEPGVEVAGGPKKGCSCGSEGEGDCKAKRRKMMLILLAAGAAIGLALYFALRKK